MRCGTYTAQPVSFAGRTWSLDDFSYAGYYLGTKSLGSVPCNVVNITATGDITQAVQAAVDSVGQAGGGSVRIPAGNFSMSAPVDVPYSNVSIEGAGSGQTIINVSANFGTDDAANDGLFAFGRALGAATNDGWVSRGATVANLTAVAGSIVVFYASGAGQTNPAGVDGSVATPPFPVPTQNVSVTIGGVQATLLYQGAAPYEIAGLLQINAVIPAGLSPSDAAPLVLTVGNAASQTASIAIQ